MSRQIVTALVLFLTGCALIPKPTEKELRTLDAPPAEVSGKMDKLFPKALAWYNTVEAQLLPQGRPLTDAETKKAQRLGIPHPELVRVATLDKFPMPDDQELLEATKHYMMGSIWETGRTIGYVIMLKPGHKNDDSLISHELVHVAQHDRMGRDAFIRRYMTEMEMMGYARSPLELEAFGRQE